MCWTLSPVVHVRMINLFDNTLIQYVFRGSYNTSSGHFDAPFLIQARPRVFPQGAASPNRPCRSPSAPPSRRDPLASRTDRAAHAAHASTRHVHVHTCTNITHRTRLAHTRIRLLSRRGRQQRARARASSGLSYIGALAPPPMHCARVLSSSPCPRCPRRRARRRPWSRRRRHPRT